MTAAEMIAELVAGRKVPGRHLVVSAHPDDETISFAGGLTALEDVTILQVTTGVMPEHPDQVVPRLKERAAALEAGGWAVRIVDLAIPARGAHWFGRRIVDAIDRLAGGVTAVWTHPYENGHLDHDTCSWAVQTALARWAASAAPVRCEFASYYGKRDGRSVFGSFAPGIADQGSRFTLPASTIKRKRAAVAEYRSQASILAKFQTPFVEAYRPAPVYDFAQPAPAPSSRWDDKGYDPPMSAWRALMAQWDQVTA